MTHKEKSGAASDSTASVHTVILDHEDNSPDLFPQSSFVHIGNAAFRVLKAAVANDTQNDLYRKAWEAGRFRVPGYRVPPEGDRARINCEFIAGATERSEALAKQAAEHRAVHVAYVDGGDDE